ncbi:MAG: helix-turn-helix domain-containing protein [Bacteroidota bacterium]
MLAALSIRVGKSVVFYFYPDLAPIFLQLGVSACIFVGPSLYFYFRAILEPSGRKDWIVHYLVLFAIVAIGGYYFSFADYRSLWQDHLIKAIYYVWLAYLLGAAWLIRKSWPRLQREGVKWSSVDTWLLSIFLGNVIVWLAYNFCYYTSYIVGALSFTFLFYLLILLLLFRRKRDFVLFQQEAKYGAKKIPAAEAALLLGKLDGLIHKQELFRNPNLTLPEVAAELKILPHRLSQLLNDNLGKSFPNYLNGLRIQAAEEMLKAGSEFGLEAIGYACGFNAKSTFYSAFKRHTGTTPAQYRKQLEERG